MKHGFYDENDEISKNAIAFTADEPKIWGKEWKFPKLQPDNMYYCTQ